MFLLLQKTFQIYHKSEHIGTLIKPLAFIGLFWGVKIATLAIEIVNVNIILVLIKKTAEKSHS